MEEKNVKQTITSKEKILEFIVQLFCITLGILILIKFREPIYELAYTDKNPFRPGVRDMFDMLDKILGPILTLMVKGVMKIGEFLDKFPPYF